jgi:hypothetical protein
MLECIGDPDLGEAGNGNERVAKILVDNELDLRALLAYLLADSIVADLGI